MFTCNTTSGFLEVKNHGQIIQSNEIRFYSGSVFKVHTVHDQAFQSPRRLKVKFVFIGQREN